MRLAEIDRRRAQLGIVLTTLPASSSKSSLPGSGGRGSKSPSAIERSITAKGTGR
jgi:hypothetical protein